MEIIKYLQEPLTDKDVEVRIGTAKANGFSLLLYKTARTDMARLNAVCGMNWQNKHYVDSKGNVICSIGIKVGDEWVWREDTGAESFTEKEKGSYSDSFKRAGFRWGIGVELYSSPFIWVSAEMKEQNKKYYPSAINLSNVEVSSYAYVDGQVFVEIKHKGDILFNNFKLKKYSFNEYKANIEKCTSEAGLNAIFNSWKLAYKKDTDEYNALLELSADRKKEIKG